MFSKELEALINASLEDGVLEEYEKAAIVKRAKSEGVDLTELEIYINSILQKRKREHDLAEDAKQEKIDQRKREAFGRVCPNCGRQVPPMTLKCECGYEFTEASTVSSIQKLSDKLLSVTITDEDSSDIRHAENKQVMRAKILTNKKVDIIASFPVPNTKEDIIEFLAISIVGANKKLGFFEVKRNFYILISVVCAIILIKSLIVGLSGDTLTATGIVVGSGVILGAFCTLYLESKSYSEEKMKKAWREKFDEVMLKARSLRGDPDFTQQLNYYENLLDE